MENIEGMVVLILGLWLLCRTRRRSLFQRRLQAARKNTAEANRRLQEFLLQTSDDEMILAARRRRMRTGHLLQHCRRRPSVWAFNRATAWWDDVVPGFTSAQWLQYFRMSEDTLIHLCHKMHPVMTRRDTSFRRCVPLKKRVAIALWKLATGFEYKTVGHLFGVSVTTVFRCVHEFCAAAQTFLVPEHICLPDLERLEQMAAFNEDRWGLPQCVGAVDGSHVPILAPPEYHCDYLNCEGWHSVVLQGVVDGKGLFWNVFAGLPGSFHDARVLRQSTLWEFASGGDHFTARTKNIGGVDVGYYVIGGSAYPLQNWLLTPFPDTGHLTAEQQVYNRKVCQAKEVVENAFGRLKGRWGCLMKRNDCDVQLVKSMAVTCCALHNLCESRGEAYDNEWDAEATEAAATCQPAVADAQGEEEEGQGVREGLMRHLNS